MVVKTTQTLTCALIPTPVHIAYKYRAYNVYVVLPIITLQNATDASTSTTITYYYTI